MGNDAWCVDWDETKVAPSFDDKREYDKAGNVFVRNGLDRSKFIQLDFLDFAMAVISEKVDVRTLHAVHDGFDCTSFTTMALSFSGRAAANFHFGTSPTAYSNNLRLHYLVALHLFWDQRKVTELCMKSSESPEAARQLHPLTLNAVERQKAKGGLGMGKMLVSYCMASHAAGAHSQKPTNLWSNHGDFVETFVRQDGECAGPRAAALRCAARPHPHACAPAPPCRYHEDGVLRGHAMQLVQISREDAAGRRPEGARRSRLNLQRRLLLPADQRRRGALWSSPQVGGRFSQWRWLARAVYTVRQPQERRVIDQVRQLHRRLPLPVHPKRHAAPEEGHLGLVLPQRSLPGKEGGGGANVPPLLRQLFWFCLVLRHLNLYRMLCPCVMWSSWWSLGEVRFGCVTSVTTKPGRKRLLYYLNIYIPKQIPITLHAANLDETLEASGGQLRSASPQSQPTQHTAAMQRPSPCGQRGLGHGLHLDGQNK